MNNQTKPRVGSTVRCGGTDYQLSSRAAPSGWWAVPLAGGKPVRLLFDSRSGWRLPVEDRPGHRG